VKYGSYLRIDEPIDEDLFSASGVGRDDLVAKHRFGEETVEYPELVGLRLASMAREVEPDLADVLDAREESDEVSFLDWTGRVSAEGV
jgi:hypothetical protein